MYLRRPPAYFPEWRLDRLLQRKAEQGVKIHVIVYKEVRPHLSQTTCNDLTHGIPPGYADESYELKTYQGDLFTGILNGPMVDLTFKAKMDRLHPNITCMRHPDHIGAKGIMILPFHN